MTEDQVSCLKQNCKCFPFIHFNVCIVNKFKSPTTKEEYRPKGLCIKCLKRKQKVTSHILVLATKLGWLELDSQKWYLIQKEESRKKIECKGASPCKLNAKGQIQYPGELTQSSYQGGAFKKKKMVLTSCETPEKCPCCQEDTLPRHWSQPSGQRQRQRSTPVGNPNGSEPRRVPDG